MKRIAIVLLMLSGCAEHPADPPSVTAPDGGTGVQMPALTNCPMPSTGWQGDAVFGPLPPYGGNLEYVVPLYYRSVIPQIYVTDNASMVYGLFQGNYWTCWDATPPQWRADGHVRGYRGMCGDQGQYATIALHVVDYGPANTDPPIDEFWFQQIDPVTGLGQWYGGKPASLWAWWYYSFFECLDLQPPYPRF